jgi:putative ABC transport system ATP-binding protein
MLTISAFHFYYPNFAQAAKAGQRTELTMPAVSASPGELVWLAGESGCGKTTLLHLIAGLLHAPLGAIHCHEQDLALLSRSQRDQWRAQTVGLVPQEPLLVESLSALHNAQLPSQLLGQNLSERIARLFSDLNLSRISHLRPAQLSRGQQQRVALIRAIAHQPALLLADEPTANLDDTNVHAVMTLFKELTHKHQLAGIIASHDSRIAPYCSRKVVF